MAAGTADEKATLPEPSSTALRSGEGAAIALTILLHPDVARVGARAVSAGGRSPDAAGAMLGPLTAGATLRIGRNEPSFAPPEGGPGAPLDVPHLSRAPFTLTAAADGSIAFDATATSTSIALQGRAITSATFSEKDVRRGLVLVLANSVVLLLHRVALPHPAPRGEDLGLFGQSDGLRAVLAEVRAVADLAKPVLLRGESGSGKELVARAIHRTGPRRAAPFIAVNLGAVPATIAAAEFFGSERGAFTGAVRRRGYFEQAEGGTLFLDEIGEAPIELQAALLRALQEGEIQPVGGERTRKVDVRVIAATDADLESRIADGSFRAPLLNRLAAYQIWIPPLRERKDDIGRLLVHFFREELRDIGEESRLETSGGDKPWLPASLVARLADHLWPGNVRQLRNVVRHLVIGNRGSARVAMTPGAERLLEGGDTDAGEPRAASGPRPPADAASPPASASSPREAAPRPASDPPTGASPAASRKVGEIGKDEVLRALHHHRFEIAAAAKELGVPRPSLDLAMTRLGIRKAGDLRVEEIRASFEAHGGDVARMTDDLQVSERALLRRVRELGLAEKPAKPPR